MANVVGLLIESLVAVLLVATIVYCAMLDRRLRRLRLDENTMRDTVVELVSATHAAERAIAGLRAAVGDSEQTLAERLGRAEALSSQMAGQLGEGEEVIGRIARIAKAARDHSEQVSARDEVERQGAEREAARRDAELQERARVEAARVAAPEPQSRSAATAAAAEIFANRIRALSLGSAA